MAVELGETGSGEGHPKLCYAVKQQFSWYVLYMQDFTYVCMITIGKKKCLDIIFSI